jgi:cell division septum initiation protein DivIVA
MEIFTLLESIEELLENSRTLPLVKKTVVDKEEILDIIKEIRLKLPDELKQAKWVKEERNRIIQEAKKEGEDIVKEAENRIIAMIDEHEITKKAYDEKDKILEQASSMAKEMSDGTKEYADSVLAGLEDDIAELKVKIDEAQANLTDALATIKNNRKELK